MRIETGGGGDGDRSAATPGGRPAESRTAAASAVVPSPRRPVAPSPRLSPGAASDKLLARSAASGDEIARGELIRRYQDRIYQVAYGFVRDRDEAMDITQDTFLQMLEGLPRFREQANFYTWLHRIALNRCIDWGRRRTRRAQPVSLDDLIEEGWTEPADGRPTSRPDQALMAKELRGQIFAAIDTVPELFRSVVLLADVEGMSIGEIAARLRCPVNTVKTRLHRGRCLVRRRLRDYLEAGG
jgi:RNA polymerase sigma-70 factor (ECF subfamily)